MPAPFQELSPSPIFNISRKGVGSNFRRIFLIDWDDIQEFTADIFGGATISGGIVISQNGPATFPGWPQLFPEDMEVTSFDEKPVHQAVDLTSTHNSYTKAKCVVSYTPVDSGVQANHPDNTPEIPEGTILEVNSEAAGEYITIPGQELIWEDDSEALSSEVSNGVLLGSESLELTWSRVARPPWSAIQNAMGKINDAPFCGYDTGHVLFLGARRRRSFQANADTLWNLGMMFKARSQPWNYAYRANPGELGHVGWQEYLDLDGENVYASTDFTLLFQY